MIEQDGETYGTYTYNLQDLLSGIDYSGKYEEQLEKLLKLASIWQGVFRHINKIPKNDIFPVPNPKSISIKLGEAVGIDLNTHNGNLGHIRTTLDQALKLAEE